MLNKIKKNKGFKKRKIREKNKDEKRRGRRAKL